MKKFKVPSGTIQKLETVFDKVQAFTADNLTNRIKRIFSTYGPTIDKRNGTIQSDSTDLKLSILTDTTKIAIAAGSGLTESNEYINLNEGHINEISLSDPSDYSAF